VIKIKKTTEKRSKILDLVFILAIVVLYIPMIHLGLNSFFPDPDYDYYDDCRKPRPVASEMSETEKAEYDQCTEEQIQQNRINDEERDRVHKIKFIIAGIIGFLTIMLVYFVEFPNAINYGLFFGGVLNMVFALNWSRDKNIVGFIIFIVLFVMTIFFIKKQLKR